MNCSFGWLMDFQRIVYLIVLNHLKNIWLQEDRDTRASELRCQKWSRYLWENSSFFFGKNHPFSQRQVRLNQIKSHPFSQRRARQPFSIAAFTCTVTTCTASSGTRSTSLVFLSNSGPVIAWFCHWLSGKMNTWSMWCWKVKGAETKEIADVDLLLDNLVTPC